MHIVMEKRVQFFAKTQIQFYAAFFCLVSNDFEKDSLPTGKDKINSWQDVKY